MGTNAPRRGYAICCEPRSGSSYLGRLLISTGQLGRPKEYFARARVRAEILADPQAGFRKLVERASTPNGVYGLKLFSYQFDIMTGSRWTSLLPDLQYIHLERRDLLGQAISYVRASQTRRFQSHQIPLQPARYHGRAIARELRRIAEDQARWRRYFARNGLPFLPLVYEEVCANPERAVAAVAELVGVSPVPAIDAAAIDLAVLRDAESDLWRRRFVAEWGDPDRLVNDGLVSPARQWLRRVRRKLDFRAPHRDLRQWP